MTLTPATHSATWIKSSYSGGEGGQCLEWAPAHATTDDAVPVRDSKNPTGPALTLPRHAWATFVTAIGTGRL